MISGIYKITNLVNNKCYIGSSNHLLRRYKDHFRLLKTNKNHSILLQNAYNKYGEDKFSFEIIAKCPIEYLFKLEQWFVNNINPDYNICKENVSVPKGIPKTEDGKRRIGLANKNKTNPNFGWKPRTILQLDNNGNTIKEYKSLTEYAKENNCAIGNVGKALKEGNKCKGYYLKYK